MSNKEGWNKCIKCGKYISIKDFDSGDAYCKLEQKWDWSNEDIRETTITLCKKCYSKEKGNNL